MFSGRLGSASSNSSCGSAEYTGEFIPHHPGRFKKKKNDFKEFPTTKPSSSLSYSCFFLGLPRQDSGHWWTSFFFAKPNQPGMQNGSDHQKWALPITKAAFQVICLVMCLTDPALCFLTGPTQWPTVRWLASPEKWFWKDNSARAVTAGSLNHPHHQLPLRLTPTLTLTLTPILTLQPQHLYMSLTLSLPSIS